MTLVHFQLQGRLAFSNLSFIGRGLRDVTVSAISLPMRNASLLLLPGRKMKRESVSP